MTIVDHDPIDAVLNSSEDAVLVVVTATYGPSYNSVGTMMAIWADGSRVGSLSLGCLEADILHHARCALDTSTVMMLHYGEGSPYFDIQLPCGGALHLALVPRPDKTVLAALCVQRAQRIMCSLDLELETGAISVGTQNDSRLIGSTLHIHFRPKLRFLIFGTGPTAEVFASLTQTAGFASMFFSPNESDVAKSRASGREAQVLETKDFPTDAQIDAHTAIILFFHDHDWELDILVHALASPAAYIGAQGSRQAHDMRLLGLQQRGITPQNRGRVRGPIGLIPSTRDPVTLSVSVLAQVLAQVQS